MRLIALQLLMVGLIIGHLATSEVTPVARVMFYLGLFLTGVAVGFEIVVEIGRKR